jgi:hypothetical protein
MAAKKKSKRSKDNAAPEGFRKVESAHISGFWVPEIIGQQVRGIVGESVTATGKDGKPNIYIMLTVTDNDSGPVISLDANKRKKPVEVGEGMIIGVGGAVLLSRLKGREGKEILAQYTGLGEKKAGKNPARMFDVYERED